MSSLLKMPRYQCEVCGHQSHNKGVCEQCQHWEMLDRLNHNDQQYLAARHALRTAHVQDWIKTIGWELAFVAILIPIVPVALAFTFALGGLAPTWALGIIGVIVLLGAAAAFIRERIQQRRWKRDFDNLTDRPPA